MIRLFFAIFTAKLVGSVTRLFHIGHGSSLPGVVAEKIDPKIAKKLSSKFKKDIILITGTNGKTTTAKLISNIIEAAGFSKIHNLTGANLVRGVISSLISHSNFFGKINSDFGLFEIDEATLPEAVEKLNPQIIIFNNLFRDQLDRYGEIDKIAKVWKKTLQKIHPATKIILNIDDPSIGFLVQRLNNETTTFGIEDEKYKIDKLPSFADAIFCPKCGTKFEYKILYLSHLGKYFCPKCGLLRPKPQVIARDIELKNTLGIKLKINYGHRESIVDVNLFGLYNVYNILAAATCGYALDFSCEIIKKALCKFTPAFGRFEKTKIEKTPATLLLIKNPTGATEVIHALTFDKKPKNLFVILNDDIPDGRDVSWIWDTEWENLTNFVNFIFISGKRAEDMILRLKYAQIPQEKMFLIKNPKEALILACKKSDERPLFILPNYSAMYSLRNFLAEEGYLPKII
ncbi:MAG: MurT ligase domain-containing protein [Patescibacteria group bacterium]